jgi:hypothetical protein
VGGCELDLAGSLELRDEPPNLTRIVGCSRDSIWFICVDRSSDDYEDDSVTMWTLQSPHLSSGALEGRVEVLCHRALGFDGFKEAGLPEAPPEFPGIAADGHLCLVLTDQRSPYEGDDVVVGHICGIDVPNKRVLWRGKVHNYPFTSSLPASSKGRSHAMDSFLRSLRRERSVNSLRNGRQGRSRPDRDIACSYRELRKMGIAWKEHDWLKSEDASAPSIYFV